MSPVHCAHHVHSVCSVQCAHYVHVQCLLSSVHTVCTLCASLNCSLCATLVLASAEEALVSWKNCANFEVRLTAAELSIDAGGSNLCCVEEKIDDSQCHRSN